MFIKPNFSNFSVFPPYHSLKFKISKSPKNYLLLLKSSRPMCSFVILRLFGTELRSKTCFDICPRNWEVGKIRESVFDRISTIGLSQWVSGSTLLCTIKIYLSFVNEWLPVRLNIPELSKIVSVNFSIKFTKNYCDEFLLLLLFFFSNSNSNFVRNFTVNLKAFIFL